MPIPHERFTQLNSEERYQDYLEEQAERRQSMIDDIVFTQRYGEVDWTADLDIVDAREALSQMWAALNNKEVSPQEAIDDARDSVMSYIRSYAEREVDENE